MNKTILALVGLFLLGAVLPAKAERLRLRYYDATSVTPQELDQLPEALRDADIISVGEISGIRHVTQALSGAVPPSWIGGVWEITIVLFKRPMTTSEGATLLRYWFDRVFPMGGEHMPYVVCYSLSEPELVIGTRVVFAAMVGNDRPVLWGNAYHLTSSP